MNRVSLFGKKKVAFFIVLILSIPLIFKYGPLYYGSGDESCQSTAYLVDYMRYNVGLNMDDRVEIDNLPDWVPQEEREIFNKARALPVDASDEQLRTLMFSSPSVRSMLGDETYKWDINRSEDYQSQIRIKKYKGCVSQIFLSLSSVPEKFGNEPVFIFQSNFVPAGAIVTNEPRESECQLGGYDGQRFEYSAQGQVKKSGSDEIPVAIRNIFRDFKAFDYRKERLFSNIGNPKISGDKMLWTIPWSGEGEVSATVTVEQNCSKELSLAWTEDGKGKKLVTTYIYN